MNHLQLIHGSSRFHPFSRSTFSLRRKVPWWGQTLDPGGKFITRWNYIILAACIVALFLDPLFFYLPIIKDHCLSINLGYGITVTLFRTLADCFFLFHIALKFRTAFVAPNSRVFGKGELVTDSKAIAMRYLKSSFVIDFAAALPLPQIVIWFLVPLSKDAMAAHNNHTINLIVFFQYLPRFVIMFPINRRIYKTTGVVAKTAWFGAAYNILLCLLCSHAIGATWYVFSLQRQYQCWNFECERESRNNYTHSPKCDLKFLDCSTLNTTERNLWLQHTHLITNCDANSDDNKGFKFGMYADAVVKDVARAKFRNKYFYCLWWGLKNLSSYGQNISISSNMGEALSCMFICIMGLVFFSHLIGNMQTNLQSATARIDEWRTRRRDTEEWMKHRQLPPELQERVRRFVQYKWIATTGVDEEAILKSLPLDLRREIKRHLCLALVRRVPFFAQMDDQLLDAICERLVSSLHTFDMFLLREGNPVNEMLFIIRGRLESSTTNGGRAGFFNSIPLGPGDFCGEELLTWALIPTESNYSNLPISTRTVKSLTEVEAFALRAKDLRFVAKQFKRLHSKKLQHAFRYYSHQWRTWGACFIQTAWRRFKRRKMAMELARQENLSFMQDFDDSYYGEDYEDVDIDDVGTSSSADNANNSQHLGATLLASKFAKNTRTKRQNTTRIVAPDDTLMPKMFKPVEPDFSAD